MDAELKRAYKAVIEQDNLCDEAFQLEGENILVYGKPGVGKTHDIKHLHISKFNGLYMVTCTPEQSAAEWRGSWILAPDKKTGAPGMEWNHGFAAKAMGKVYAEDAQGNRNLVLDRPKMRAGINEIDHAGPDVEAWLYAFCDDRREAEIHLPNGDTLFADEGMQVIASSNEPPEALLPAIKDRFTIRIRRDLPSQAQIDALPTDLRDFCLKVSMLEGDRYLSYREISKFAKLRDVNVMNPFVAAKLVWQERGETIINSYNLAGTATA